MEASGAGSKRHELNHATTGPATSHLRGDNHPDHRTGPQVRKLIAIGSGREVWTGTLNGARTMFVQPALHADNPQRDLVAPRRAANFGEPWPYCGTTAVMSNGHYQRFAAPKGRTMHVTVRHDDWCPVPKIKGWAS